MRRLRIRGNIPILFLLFFGTTTLLGGVVYQAYGLYVASHGDAAYGLLLLTSALGFLLSLLVVSRILYKTAVPSRPADGR